mmetsp:Transcript_10118/g.22758  ORF Transcript_10118/g.22758 Transcript_10118/m.22758 type:complete len:538 (+) Transcript_10118:119-1732(+)
MSELLTGSSKACGSRSAAVRSLSGFSPVAGLGQFLCDPTLSDLTVALPGGARVPAHRLILAARSDVLRAQFTAVYADSKDAVWSPSVGCETAWQWLLRWMYGMEDRVPVELMVDLLLLADHFQIAALTSELLKLEVRTISEAVCMQVLEAWAVPDVLVTLAGKCMPLEYRCPALWQRLWTAQPCNAAALLRHVPVLCELDRLRLIREYIRRQGSVDTLQVPDSLLAVIAWHRLPSHWLEEALAGQPIGVEECLGAKLQDNQRLHLASGAAQALATRCRMLEQHLWHRGRDSNHGKVESMRWPGNVNVGGYLTPLGSEFLVADDAPLHAKGLFGRQVDLSVPVEVKLSQDARANPEASTALFELGTPYFGTGSTELGWIEVSCSVCSICPTHFGLKHGRRDDSQVCHTYVIEAETADAEWVELLQRSHKPLQRSGEVIPVPADVVEGRFFRRFRVRMTRPNNHLDGALMLSWFEVWGTFRTPLHHYVGEHQEDVWIPLPGPGGRLNDTLETEASENDEWDAKVPEDPAAIKRSREFWT